MYKYRDALFDPSYSSISKSKQILEAKFIKIASDKMKMFVVFVTLLVVLVQTEAVFNCAKAESPVSPCLLYVIGFGSAPSMWCCEGLKQLNALILTQEDRRAACECYKQAATQIPNFKDDLATSLPQKCGVDVQFQFGKNVNCNK
ncbi:hypothetical protein RJT34_27406 [Clitoria ternatea]|uniref:Non-specific lipid-transfer protein n=1 Tax=Clitoria ternatea TaxID=43366 RepID=A0AAN9F856_CLITE